MKSFFSKIQKAPDLVTRNILLKKLALIRGYSAKDQSNINIKRILRNKIKQTEGHTQYFYNYRGHKFFVGNEFSLKKELLFYIKSEQFVNTLREQREKSLKKEVQSVDRRSSFERLRYDKIGNVMRHGETFSQINKKFRRVKAQRLKRPNTPDRYVGIELEFASKLSVEQFAAKVAELELHDSVRVMRDGSISVVTGFPFQVEFCILFKLSEIDQIFEKLKLLIKEDLLVTNSSCGLHVHLDARKDEKTPSRIFGNLVNMQSLLFGITDETRRSNRYCIPVPNVPFDSADDFSNNAHYYAISKFSYSKHRTIEVRIHHSTLDLQRIKNWVMLLHKIADYEGEHKLILSTAKDELTLLKNVIKPETQLIEYVEKFLGAC